MIKTSIALTMGLGAIAASYFYGQVFIGLVAAVIVAIINLLYAVYTAAMGVMALSAVPYIVIGLAAALISYSIMLRASKWYYSEHEPPHLPEGSQYKIAIVAIILGLVAAVVCKIFFAAAIVGAISFVSGIIATIAGFAFINAISTALTAALTAEIFPTVLAYIAVGAASAYAAKSFIGWCVGLFSPRSYDGHQARMLGTPVAVKTWGNITEALPVGDPNLPLPPNNLGEKKSSSNSEYGPR